MAQIDFSTIRPFEPEELPAVYDRLMRDEAFRKVLPRIMPGVDAEMIGMMMHRCLTNLDFQKVFCYGFLENVLEEQSSGCSIDLSAVDILKRYTFISNHRDIILDSAILSKLLLDNGFSTTCEVAIGDNLLGIPWVKDVARINKAFIVERSLQPREMLLSSKRLSEYMHFVIGEKHDNIWIAQREGRAKDSNDRTQPSILKMMAMGGDGDAVDRLISLHIAPVAISYEYDPCDYLKAREMLLRRDNPDFRKAKGDDEKSMLTGIMGRKGQIYYDVAPTLDHWLDAHCRSLPRTELFNVVAQEIDRHIHSRYRLFAGNYAAAFLLTGNEAFKKHFSEDEKEAFEHYIAAQMDKIDVERRDDLFLRTSLLTMYANPVFNKERSNLAESMKE